jgi:hypothetical protein
MTTIWESIRRLLSGERDVDSSRWSYTVYWTKNAIAWDEVRRREVALAVEEIITSPDFEPNRYQRRYQIPVLDTSGHSGLSLLALRKVLEAMHASSKEEEARNGP